MAGVPLTAIGSLLGHRSINTTARYAHLSPEFLADVVAKLTRYSHKNGEREDAEVVTR